MNAWFVFYIEKLFYLQVAVFNNNKIHIKSKRVSSVLYHNGDLVDFVNRTIY